MMTGFPGPGVPLSRRRILRSAGSTSLGLLAAGGASGQSTAGTSAACEPAMAPHGPLVTLLQQRGLDTREFGAKFDGASDDAPALQRAIDAAHEQRRSLQLPGGTALLGQPLSLIGRDLTIVGEGMTATVLRASREMPVLIDIEESAERIVSPVALMRLALDGSGMVLRNLAIRYRHHSWLFEVLSTGAGTGFWERDCWLSRRYNCRAHDNRIGWHVVGSNHSSLWEACTITACTHTHLAIGNEGTATDGNASLLFRGCDVEFGTGHGVAVAAGVNAVFDGCYLGENIGGDTLRNEGFVVMRGGTFFFGGGAGVGIRPIGGMTSLEHVTINAQSGGIAMLVNLTPTQAEAGHGQVRITEANANLPVGGDPVLQGDPLARVPMTVFAARLGRDWESWGVNAVITQQHSPGGLPDGREVSCTAVRGNPALMGLRAPLTPQRWREAAPVYLACVYRSSAPFALRLRSAGGDATHPMIEVPASPSRATYVNVSLRLPATGFSVIEAVMQAVPGARLGLQELTLADGTNIQGPAGNLRTLALAQ